ncbi:MAG: pentapeptide repeat-containing protein [Oculatellaceae cyanobacterium bins.114]|nr:pentapeptide repeat-containing protein [Oculatellaceae cyanobacterium bins.114]
MKKSKQVRPIATSFSVRTAVLLGILILLVAWQVPKWQTSNVGPSNKDQADVENAYRQTILQAIGGLFFLATAYLSWKNLQISEDKQITERFSKAVEMLGNEDLIEVRLGGIYILSRIAKDSPEDHWTVMEVLTAFIRERSASQRLKAEDAADPSQEPASVTTDIQAAINVVGERNVSNDPRGRRLDLTEANLAGANLSNTDFTGAKLTGANLSNIDFTGAKLNNADLHVVNLRNTNLTGAGLNNANLCFANLRNTNLTGAELNNADLCFADLDKVVIDEKTQLDAKWRLVWRVVNERVTGANLGNEDLSCANLTGVNLSNANLGYANLSKAILDSANLTEANLSGANLVDTDLRRSNLTEVILNGADLTEADLQNAILCKAALSGANLTFASLDGANLNKADFSGATLKWTSFSNAKNWTDEQLDTAKLCKTQLPEGSNLDPDRDCSK